MINARQMIELRQQFKMEYLKQQKKLQLMGCTPTWNTSTQAPQNINKCRQTVKLQYINDKRLIGQSRATGSCDEMVIKNRHSLHQKQQKIEFLKENKLFIDQSIEASRYVNNALVTLSANPLFNDISLPKLIGQNRKSLVLKQNRSNNLAKRQEKAELQLKKQKEKTLEKNKSQVFKTIMKKENKVPKSIHNDSKSQTNLKYFKNKHRFTQKLDKIGLQLLESKSLIE